MDRILCDIDGVILDSVGSWLRSSYPCRYGPPAEYDLDKALFQGAKDEYLNFILHYHAAICPLPGALTAINRLMEKYAVQIVTARTKSQARCFERQYGYEVWSKHLPCPGEILIDDYPDWRFTAKRVFLVSQPWNLTIKGPLAVRLAQVRWFYTVPSLAAAAEILLGEVA
jgi:hypothetical protein